MYFRWCLQVPALMKFDLANMKYTVTVLSENKPGVLYRIADLFLRRKVNIESLSVAETEQHGISRFVIVVEREPGTIEKLVKQIHRIVEVMEVSEQAENQPTS